MIFDNEITYRGTKRKISHYCKNGKTIKQLACIDMRESDIHFNRKLFDREKDLKAINQYNNIIYLH